MTVKNLSQFANKKVTVVHTVEGQDEAVETEGTVSVANEGGVLIKPKGKTQMVLIEAANIEDVRYIEEKPKEIKAKMLKPVEFGQARSHLLERHGFELEAVNKLSEKEAYETHEAIDHKNLGHFHGVKEDKPADADAA